MGWFKHWRLIILVVLTSANVLIWGAVAEADRTVVLTISFLNIGQGDAILIEAPNGRQVLIDGGPNQAVLRELGRALPFYDRSLDLVIATHPDADHVGGLVPVLERYQVAGFMEPGIRSETQTYAALERAVKQEGATKILARRGQVVDLGRGASLQILFPDSAGLERAQKQADTNAASVVAKLVYGATSALLTGDAPLAVERALLSWGVSALDVDLLKLGHHGSRTSSAPAFLQATTPAYAIISAGKNNRYGHPHVEVLQALETQKIPALQTAERGTIVFESDGRELTLESK